MDTQIDNKDRGAFPGMLTDGNISYLQFGLSKREYFAAMAMQGLLANNSLLRSSKLIAEYSIDFADELLNQLEHGK